MYLRLFYLSIYQTPCFCHAVHARRCRRLRCHGNSTVFPLTPDHVIYCRNTLGEALRTSAGHLLQLTARRLGHGRED